ncbi:unnamed protein product [Effrenium voratum]|uniref:Uncharacterized protein n=1 Tax=Effrenium voratum TaxID=2562239 RepID=A0AA36MZD4_9DINO|nr:unnamed protein product [Effrenium voratum]
MCGGPLALRQLRRGGLRPLRVASALPKLRQRLPPDRGWAVRGIWKDRKAYAAVGLVLCFLVLWLCLDLLSAHCRETTNVTSLKAGYMSRWRAKLRNNYVHGRPQYPLCSRLHRHSEGAAPIGGPGQVLCMNWFSLVGALGLWLSALALALAPPWHAKLLDPSMAYMCKLPDVHVPFHTHWAAASYLGAALMTAAFLVWQSVHWTRMTHDTSGDICLHYYCVEAMGFPPEATNKLELLEYFRSQMRMLGLPSDGIQYLSIGYKFRNAARIEEALEAHLEEEEAKDPMRCPMLAA